MTLLNKLVIQNKLILFATKSNANYLEIFNHVYQIFYQRNKSKVNFEIVYR